MTSVAPVKKAGNVIQFPQKEKPKDVKLTPAEEKAWSDTRVKLLWHCPAFSHILYTMLNKSGSEYVAYFTEDVPIAATDGECLLLNPKTFFKYNLNERLFIVAHEIMHCIFNHIVLMHAFHRRGKVSFPDGTSLPFDQETMNIAADYVINDALIEAKVGLFNSDWLHDTNVAVGTDSVIDAYRKAYKKKSGKSPKGKGFDEHLPPGTTSGQSAQEAANGRNDVEWATQIAAAANAARAQGKLPAGLERLLDEVIEPKVDWQDKILSFFHRKVGSGSYDWKKPDRRYIQRDIYAPGRSGFGAGTIVIAVDTSGSISDTEVAMFFGEMGGILETIRPRRMVVMWCDAKVHRTDEVEEAGDLAELRSKKAPGGGGTDFVPVFDEIKSMGLEPDALVYFTDGYGRFPSKETEYPMIWGNISGKEVTYPFGDVVDIPRQA